MRCLALAQAWRAQGGDAVLATVEVPANLAARYIKEGVEVERLPCTSGSREDATATIGLTARKGTKLLVVDGYQLGSEFHDRLRRADLRTLMIDDCGVNWRPAADWILNQNVQAQEGLYPSRLPQTRLLLGCNYALLRQEFRSWCDWQRQHAEQASRVLITLGGSDPDNVTSALIDALAAFGLRHLEYRVVVGAGNPHLPTIQRATCDGRLRAEVLTDVQDLSKLMAWADVAVSAGGSTCWELAMMGLPALLIVLAENQRPAVELLDRQGAFRGFGSVSPKSLAALASALGELCADRAARQRMSEHGRQLVDGLGARRVVDALREGRLQ